MQDEQDKACRKEGIFFDCIVEKEREKYSASDQKHGGPVQDPERVSQQKKACAKTGPVKALIIFTNKFPVLFHKLNSPALMHNTSLPRIRLSSMVRVSSGDCEEVTRM